MQKETKKHPVSSIPYWDHLDEWVRLKVQELIQSVLEEEVTDLLGRTRYSRKDHVDSSPGYRNGYGKPRKLTLSNGTITVRRPRVRNLDECFESRVLPLFERRSKALNAVIPELYLHGLSEGDFDLALRGLLGDEAPLSAATVARLKEKWQDEYDHWKARSLTDLDVVYLWVDGVYVKAGLEKSKACALVAIAGLRDGSKVMVQIETGYRESKESWAGMLRDLKRRGMKPPRLVIGDGHLGIWSGLHEIYPQSEEQQCWNHKMRNALDKLPKKHQERAKEMLRDIVYAETVAEAEKGKKVFQVWCGDHGFEKAAEVLDRNWQRMITFYRFPKQHWKHLRTSNIVESPFAAVRLRTDAAKRYKKVKHATAVLWKTLLVVEKRFRKLNAPEMMEEVFLGIEFADGKKANKVTQKKAA